MKTRIIHTKVWKDKWFVNLSKDAKVLWLYLLTNDKINISGVYELTDREILFDTSIDTSILESKKKELYPKAVFFNGWVRVANIERYNRYRNSPLNEIAYRKEMSYLSEDEFRGLGIPTDTSIYTPINKKQEIINNKSEIRNKKRIEDIKKETREKLKSL